MGGGGGGGRFGNTKGGNGLNYPGDNPANSPGKQYEWRGSDVPSSGRGSWFDSNTGETWHPDLNHQGPIGPHWDYTDSLGNSFSVFPDGRIDLK